jgi:hypothetical protein
VLLYVGNFALLLFEPCLPLSSSSLRMSYWIFRFLILFHRYAAATGCIWNHWTAPGLLALHRVGEHGTALLTPLRSRRIRSGATRMISCVEVRQEEEILCHNATLCIKIWRTLYLYEGTYRNNTVMRNQKGKSDVACHVLRQGCKRGSHCLLMHNIPSLIGQCLARLPEPCLPKRVFVVRLVAVPTGIASIPKQLRKDLLSEWFTLTVEDTIQFQLF